MSLWYDVKKKIYASSPNDNWYISYIKKMCDKLNSTLSARISNHISAIAERHTASDIDYSEGKTVRQALDEEISARENADASNQTKIEQSISQLQSEYKAADNTLKQSLIAEDSPLRSEIESTAITLRQEFNDAVTEKSNVLTAADTQLQTQISELDNTKVDEIELERLKYYGDNDIVPSDESYFTVDESGTIIIGLSDTGITQTELVIPYVINGILITQICENCFLANKSITKVIIPNSVTSIGYEAFATCTSLTDVQVSNSVNSISSGLFKECTLLSSVNIPEGVINIYSEAFLGCTSLSSINIPDSVTEIGTDAFSDCTSLSSINIPDSVKTIEIGAFGGCTSLVNVKVPNSTKYMVTSMFSGCTSLKNITIPDSVIDIEPNAFWSCTSLTKVNIPNGVTSIGSTAFENCPNLTIYCEQGSYAETFAKENNIPVVYTDINESYVKNARPYIENTIPTSGELSLNTIYDIGIQSDLTLILPTAEVGNFIQVDFLSGATATTLTVSAASSALLSDYDFTPEPNMIYSLFFDYGVLAFDETTQSNIYGWRFSFAEYTYTPDESEG